LPWIYGWSKAGGGGQVYAQSTNPEVSTGDGVGMAHRAGALLRDLEFFQFHPTALTKAGAPRFLISEAVRGEGAHLVDEDGYRFTFDYHPDGELAPRDVVSRAIFSHLETHSQDPATGCVWLDLRPIPVAQIQHRFPNILRFCQKWGIDILNQPIPVAPAAHYWMGGIYTDLMTQTSIPGVYAVGETTSTGVHGANRLASNSLLECVVFGAQLSKIEIEPLPPLPEIEPSTEMITPSLMWEGIANFHQQVQTIRQELPRLMWKAAGICREGDKILRGIERVKLWQAEFNALPISQLLIQLAPPKPVDLPDLITERELRTWGETRNLLDIALLILGGAALRTESRGGHYRTDFPTLDRLWQVHTLVEKDRWSKSTPIEID
jgi:L-aspartate oxidase